MVSQGTWYQKHNHNKGRAFVIRVVKSGRVGEGMIDYFHLSIEDYGAPSLEELDHAVNYISRQLDNGRPVMVHCSGGKGRTGTILAAYLIKKRIVMNAYQAINKLRKIRGESIQSKD